MQTYNQIFLHIPLMHINSDQYIHYESLILNKYTITFSIICRAVWLQIITCKLNIIELFICSGFDMGKSLSIKQDNLHVKYLG